MKHTSETQPWNLTERRWEKPQTDESVYIAGPECFYIHGNRALQSMKLACEAEGFNVSLPNDTKIDFNQQKQWRADDIFYNCARSMNESTSIICDLELYRGTEPDGGSVYEIGMAYARGMRIYGYSRDMRPTSYKDWTASLEDGVLRDGQGWELPYAYLPFGPCLLGSTRMIEGGFFDALERLIEDRRDHRVSAGMGEKSDLRGVAVSGHYDLSAIEGDSISDVEKYQDSHRKPHPSERVPEGRRTPVVYVAGPRRYAPDAIEHYARIKEVGESFGWSIITPVDPAQWEDPGNRGCVWEPEEDPFAWAGRMFARFVSHVESCDVLVGDLSDFHGYEPQQDVSFECGMAYQLNKGLWGHMHDATLAKDRIPNFGVESEYRDQTGANVEDFDYPINLMFSSSMEITEGDELAAFDAIRSNWGV